MVRTQVPPRPVWRHFRQLDLMPWDVIERASRLCRHIVSRFVQFIHLRIDPKAYPMRQAMLFFLRAVTARGAVDRFNAFAH